MLVSKENIHDLLPQRYPMVMIDHLLECDEKHAVSQFIIASDNLFCGPEGFTAAGLMENMAQTAAARKGYLLRNLSGDANKKPPVGVIGSIKNFKLHDLPQTGSVLQTTVWVEHEVLQASVVKGKVEVNGNLAAECDMQIFLTEDEPGSG